MADDSIFVSEIEKICKERSERWPRIKIGCDWLGEGNFIKNYFDTSDIPLLNHILEIKCSQSDLNSALQKAYESGDIVLVGLLLDKGADVFCVLNEKYFFLDYECTSITVELVKRTNRELFAKCTIEELNEKNPSYYWSPIYIGYLIGCYASIRKCETEQKDNNIIQNCKKLREDIVTLLSMIKDVVSKPLPGLRIPGDFRFESPISFHEMLNDQGDEIDSRFARRVFSLLDPGSSIFEY